MKTDEIEVVKKPETVIIQPVKGLVALNLRDLWIYRELVYFLTWRDLKVRYKQSVLGVLWAIIKPFLAMVVFTIFFGNLAKMPSDGLPYPVWSLYRSAALGVFCCSIKRVCTFNAYQRKYGFKDLLSTHHCSAFICLCQSCRFLDCFCNLNRHDVCVSHHPHH